MKIEYKVIAGSIAFGLAVWTVDAAIDYFFFYESTFWELMITDIPKHELYIRLPILAFFTTFGILMSNVIGKLKRTRDELRNRNQQLVANEQQLKAANQQFVASDQQLKAANQQLVASDQQLRATNQELVAGERKLRQQSGFLRNVINSIGNPFYVIDANDYTIIDANDYAVKLANCTDVGTNQLTDKTTCYALTHGLDKPCGSAEHQCPIELVKRTKKPAVVEHAHCNRDSRGHVFEYHAHPIFDEA
ncbi:MAG: hypothetical protein KAT00_04095, partial [Planctomycetes bacterium]|nr:hypothetical protein [Planctomycetota bacterium]